MSVEVITDVPSRLEGLNNIRNNTAVLEEDLYVFHGLLAIPFYMSFMLYGLLGVNLLLGEVTGGRSYNSKVVIVGAQSTIKRHGVVAGHGLRLLDGKTTRTRRS